MSLHNVQYPATVGYRYSRSAEDPKPPSPNPKPSWRGAPSWRKKLHKWGKRRREKITEETVTLSRRPSLLGGDPVKAEDGIPSIATDLSDGSRSSSYRRSSGGSSTKDELKGEGLGKHLTSAGDRRYVSSEKHSKPKPLQSESSSMRKSHESNDTRKEMDLPVRPTKSSVHWRTRLRVRGLSGYRHPFSPRSPLSAPKLSGGDLTPLDENTVRSRFSDYGSVHEGHGSSLPRSDSDFSGSSESLHPPKALRTLRKASMTSLRYAFDRTASSSHEEGAMRENGGSDKQHGSSLHSPFSGGMSGTLFGTLGRSTSTSSRSGIDKRLISYPILDHSSLDTDHL